MNSLTNDIALGNRFRAIYNGFVKEFKRGPLAFWFVTFALNIPLLALYLRSVWRQEQYQYVPFLLVSIAWLAWARIPGNIVYPNSLASKMLFGLSILALLIGNFLLSPWSIAVSFVLFASSFLVSHQVGYLSIPLLLMIRAPRGYDALLVTWLQGITTRISSFMLDLFSVPHLVQGNVIELADRELFVAEACSGVQSAFTIAFISLFVIVWHRRPLVLIPLYLLISLMWAVICNTLRVTVIAIAAAYAQVDLSTGFVHDLIGYAALVIAILLTLSTDVLLSLLFRPILGDGAWEENPIALVWNWMFANDTPPEPDVNSEGSIDRVVDTGVSVIESGKKRYAMIMIASVALLSLFPFLARATFSTRASNPDGNLLIDPSSSILDGLSPAVRIKFSDSMRNGRDPRLGMHADQWAIAYSDLAGTIVFSQPYPEWHNLNICYTGSGWVVLSSQYLRPGGDARDRTEIVLSRFQRGDGSVGYLFFTGLASDGSVLAPPGVGIIRQIFDRCSNWLTPRLEFSGDNAMLQLWVASPAELDSQTIATLVDTLAVARDRFSDEMKIARQN
jgi:exosortase